MAYAGVCDWKDRIVYTKTWVTALALSLAIALFRKYSIYQIITYSMWLSAFFIVTDIVCTVIYKVKDKPFLINRNLAAIKAVMVASKFTTQENIDMARGFVFGSSNKKIVNSKLDTMQHKLNNSMSLEDLLKECARKIGLAEISNTESDLYTAEAFLLCIPKNNRKDLYKRIKKLPDKIVDERCYGIGWGDIKIAPAVTLFYGSMGTTIMLVVILLSLIGQKLIKQNDESIPLVTYMAVGCMIAFLLN